MWSAPPSVLRLVAVLLLACAVTAFTLGLLGAEPRGGRLPGEAATGETGATVVATEAQPLQDPGTAPPAAEPEEDEAVETAEAAPAPAPEASTEAQVPALQVPDVPAPVRPAPPPQKAPAPAQPAPKGDAIGDLVDGLTPPEDLPPF